MKTNEKKNIPSIRPLGRFKSFAFSALLALASLQSTTLLAAEAFEASAEIIFSESGLELSCENTDDDIQDIIEQMADLGYGIKTAQLEFWKYDFSSRETTQWAKDFEIPFAERNSHYMVLTYDSEANTGKYDNVLNSFQDAIVFRGCTPPELTNMRLSFQSFLEVRQTGYDESGEETFTQLIRGSLTDPLWLENLKTQTNDNSLFPAPYDRKTNIVFSADQRTIDDLKTAFTNADLLTNDEFNVHALPTDRFNFTDDPGGYPLTQVLRIFMKWDRLEDYHPDAAKLHPSDYISEVYTRQSFPVYIFYRDAYEVREKIPENLRKTKPPRAQQELARSYKKLFTKMVKEVITHYQNQGLQLVSDTKFSSQGAYVEGLPVFNAEHGDYCIANTVDCQYDSYADAYWWNQQTHQLEDDDVYVVVGVDHAKLGMADGGSYLGIYDLQDAEGKLAQEIDSWTGSELSWSKVNDAVVFFTDLSLEPLGELSFLVQLTRPHNCMEGDPAYAFRCADTTQIAEDDVFIFRGRTSFNPATGTRPSNSQLIPWRLLHFKN